MPELTASRFGEFVNAVHGPSRRPFPWQQQLADQLLSLGSWPDAIDAPTGLGKTSVLDAATYAAAAGVPLRRVFFVVDRRLVVDEAYEHARRLHERVIRGADGVLGEVAGALASLSGNTAGAPVAVQRMRGGITWDWRWMDRPDRFGIVVGTVDQIGSRLLFRGYGLSDRLKPIDAALTGTDSVIFVDEAHLAEPMLATLRAAQRLDTPQRPVGRPARIVQLSATRRPSPGAGEPIAFDVAAHLADPVAARRLQATKTLHTAVTTDSAADAVLASAALAATGLRPDALVGVVVNTVARARAVFDLVRVASPRTVLLTGRQRPWDRDRLLRQHGRSITVGWRERPGAAAGPMIVVATQCIEVGANIDLDALLTESAPWDNLVQRIGRVNRTGAISAPDRCPVVVVRTDHSPADLIYGVPRIAAWEWLTGHVVPMAWNNAPAAAHGMQQTFTAPGRDASPLALRTACAPAESLSTARPAPVLFPQHLEGWGRTAPVPVPDAPVAPFLHGFDTTRATVRVCWRGDLPLTDQGDPDLPAWEDSIATLPPHSEEELEIPLSAARAWLARQPAAGAVTDDDTEAPATAPTAPRLARPETTAAPLAALRIGHDGGFQLVPPGQLRPDDRIVVPTSYGGLDAYGWAPLSTRAVLDIADVVSRRRPAVRLHPHTLPPIVAALLGDEAGATAAELLRLLGDRVPDDEALDDLLQDSAPADVHDALQQLTAIVRHMLTVNRHPPDPPVISPRRLALRQGRARAAAIPSPPLTRVLLTAGVGRRADDRDSTSSSTGDRTVLLDEHHAQVGALAATIAENLHLPDDVAAAVAQAAAWHDLGKLDPRFQTLLHGSAAAAADALLAGAPRAKSDSDPAYQRGREARRRASGYPPGGRHEALSAALVRHRLQTTDHDLDADLVEHLVAAHHGNARPLLPAVVDPHAPDEIAVPDWPQRVRAAEFTTVDWTGPGRFRRLCTRYGLWGLALLETVVRLADIACSAGERPETNGRP